MEEEQPTPPPEPQAPSGPAEATPEPLPQVDAEHPSDVLHKSKSNLVADKSSTMISKKESHVRLQEPAGEGDRKPSDVDKRKSVESRRTSELRRSTQISSSTSHQRGSYRESIRQSRDTSKDRIMRRTSERPSKAKSAVGSIISFGKASGYGDMYVGGKVPKFMNTYKLDSDKPFHVERVEKILRDVLVEALENLTYDADKCPKQAKWACSAIRAKVKEQEYDRYKLVCLVTIGEKRYQDVCSVVRFLWDIDRDKYAIFVHENLHVYAAAMCFGLYYE